METKFIANKPDSDQRPTLKKTSSTLLKTQREAEGDELKLKPSVVINRNQIAFELK
jgi:hypothetical protein